MADGVEVRAWRERLLRRYFEWLFKDELAEMAARDAIRHSIPDNEFSEFCTGDMRDADKYVEGQ
jgi:hypothetical protein